jgi:glycosyltransferase involved in cell wall biosynthesis
LTPASEIAARNISVIIPARAAAQTLPRCLAAIRAADPAPGEVIVVVDGADDTLAQIVTESGAKLIQLETSRGAAAARNAGVEASTGTLLLFIDADVVIASNTIGQAIASLGEHPEWSAVFGSYDADPGAANFVSQYKGLLNHFVHQAGRVEASTFWSALGAIHRNVFVTVGGFDETSRLEDIELGYRLRAAGYRIGLNPKMLAKHLKHWTTLSLIRSDFFDRALPWTELILKYRNGERDLNLDRTNRLSVMSVFLLAAAMIGTPFFPLYASWLAAAFVAALLYLNRRLYRFFLHRRGAIFLCGAIACHWLYFLYGGLAFLVGALRHTLARSASRDDSRDAPPAAVTRGVQ